MTLEHTIGHNNPPTQAEIINEQLTERNETLLSVVDQIIEGIGRSPDKCEDDLTAKKISDFIKIITHNMKKLETLRVEEKDPYLSMGRIVDEFFKERISRLKEGKELINKPLDAYMKLKDAAERQRRLDEAKKMQEEAAEKMKMAAQLETSKMPSVAAVMMDSAVSADANAKKMLESAAVKPCDMVKIAGVTLRTVWTGEIENPEILDLEILRPHIGTDALQKALNSFVRAGGRGLKGAKIYEKSDTVVR